MKSKDLKTVILVDDVPSSFNDGGYGAPTRIQRYKVLFKELGNDLNGIEHIYLILGDGIFELDIDSYKHTKKEDFGFGDADVICGKIRTIKNDPTLILMDYMLNNRTPEADEGMKLSRYILNGIYDCPDTYILLYCRAYIDEDDLYQAFKNDFGGTETENIYNSGSFLGMVNWKVGAPTDTATIIKNTLNKKWGKTDEI